MVKVEFKAGELFAKWRGDKRKIKAHLGKRLSYWGQRVISSIKQDQTLFTHDKSNLKNSLWTRRQKGQLVQEMGWAVPYGYVLEWGPKTKRTWVIRPKGFRSDISQGRSGGGVALKALRWKSGGKWVYAKRVKHVWNTSQLRPHFEPWLQHYHRHILQDLAEVPHRILEGELT